ncbi:MAG TPA: universal stress protein [Polyangia bacterium]|jgi:nucleotide-binding universal stress UspA family protein
MSVAVGDKGRTVLCALDIAPPDARRPDAVSSELFLGDVAEAALRAADDEARRSGAELALFHALPLDAGAPMSPAAVEQAMVNREELARTVIDGLSRTGARVTGRPADELTVLVEDGAPDEAIVRAAERLSADLLVLGDRGAQARRRPFWRALGSVAGSVVQRAPCSVLVVRRKG